LPGFSTNGGGATAFPPRSAAASAHHQLSIRPSSWSPGNAANIRWAIEEFRMEEAMMLRRLMVLLGSASLVGMPSQAGATITETIGGPGGQPFELGCPKDQFAVGFRANTGAWIDRLALLCSTDLRGVRRAAGAAGGGRGHVQEIYCPSGAAMTGFVVTFTRGHGLTREYVDSAVIKCGAEFSGCISTGDGCFSRVGPDTLVTAGDLYLGDFIDCPEGEVMTGLVGRAGDYVDAVGAVCATMTRGVIHGTASNAAQGIEPPKEPGGTDVARELNSSSANTLAATRPATPSSPQVSDGLNRSLPNLATPPH
jgi:hypothetical protein